MIIKYKSDIVSNFLNIINARFARKNFVILNVIMAGHGGTCL